MRVLQVLSLAAVVMATGCGGSAPTAPSQSSAAGTMSGTWVGNASDSSGTMMGAGTRGMMGGASWTITQTGDTFSGTMYMGGHYAGQMSGTVSGRSGSFSMTLPSGSSMMTGGCHAYANGTFDMDDRMLQLHGTYSGTNSCTGAFDHGQMAMTHQ